MTAGGELSNGDMTALGVGRVVSFCAFIERTVIGIRVQLASDTTSGLFNEGEILRAERAPISQNLQICADLAASWVPQSKSLDELTATLCAVEALMEKRNFLVHGLSFGPETPGGTGSVWKKRSRAKADSLTPVESLELDRVALDALVDEARATWVGLSSLAREVFPTITTGSTRRPDGREDVMPMRVTAARPRSPRPPAEEADAL